MAKASQWFVYVIQSETPYTNRRGRLCAAPYYVGCTTWVPRRLRQHNGEIKGGGRYTSKHRPWCLRAVFGPFPNQSLAQKAERALKKGKRGQNRCHWKPEHSKWCPPWPNQGTLHPWVADLSWEPDPLSPTWRGDTSGPVATPPPGALADPPGELG